MKLSKEYLRDTIRHRLEAKAEISELMNEIDGIQEKIDTLEEAVSAYEAIIALSGARPEEPPGPVTSNGQADWARLTRADAIAEAFRETGRPLKPGHIRDIFQTHGRSEAKTNGISATLDSFKGKRFMQVGAGFWDLIRTPEGVG
jgi:hypothetical protein